MAAVFLTDAEAEMMWAFYATASRTNRHWYVQCVEDEFAYFALMRGDHNAPKPQGVIRARIRNARVLTPMPKEA